MPELTDDTRAAILLAAKLLTGHKRRRYQAEMANTYCGGSPRRAEATFGWGRDAVHTGLNELRSGIRCLDAFNIRGRHKAEEACPELEEHIHRLVDPHAQADPKFQTPFAYTRVTAKAVRDALLAVPELDAKVPGRQTVGDILNRLGYRLRAVLKTRPEKKSPRPTPSSPTSTPPARAACEPDTLRLSIDCKAKVKVGDFSRGGSARGAEAVRASDHDMGPEAVLVPFGVLELSRGVVPIHQPWLLFGHSRETSDFLADGLDLWWSERKAVHRGVSRLHIELDNGPELGGNRTQFLKRLVGFADRHGVVVELAYLPPYHSKYNPVERCWGILERHWNGALLSTVGDVLRWAGSMTWRGHHPLVRETKAVYERGVRVAKKAFAAIAERLTRSPTLPKWSLTIQPPQNR